MFPGSKAYMEKIAASALLKMFINDNDRIGFPDRGSTGLSKLITEFVSTATLL